MSKCVEELKKKGVEFNSLKKSWCLRNQEFAGGNKGGKEVVYKGFCYYAFLHHLMFGLGVAENHCIVKTFEDFEFDYGRRFFVGTA